MQPTRIGYTLMAVAILAALPQGASAAPALQPYDFIQPVQNKTAQANAWIEVSRSAFEHNINTVQASLTQGSQLCAVMKADAYGHGMALLMPTIINKQISCIGIASNEEARIARSEGYEGRILRVRQATVAEATTAMAYDVEEMLGNADIAQAIGRAAISAGRLIKVHIATNAGGMSRNGLELSTDKGQQDALAIIATPGLKTVAIMTHFAEEDKAFIDKALAKFLIESDGLIKQAGLDRQAIQLHGAASFATAYVPASQMDMVRVGGSLYGDLPGHETLRRVMAFKSRVASVNTYPAGNTVGYDRTLELARDSRLANITVGYSDGYRRLFTNKAFVIINGQRVRTMGKVSMNTIMADVTDLADIKPGDEVVLFGAQHDVEISQAELEQLNGGVLLADLYTVWGNSNIRVLVD